MALITSIVDGNNELNVYYINKEGKDSVQICVGTPFSHSEDIFLDKYDVEWLINELTELKELLK